MYAQGGYHGKEFRHDRLVVLVTRTDVVQYRKRYEHDGHG